MGTDSPESWPVGLARNWVLLYNRYAFLVLAVREFTRKGWPTGCLQDVVSEAAAAVVDAADRLRALGHCPSTCFAGEEADLWKRTLQYVYALPWRTPPAGTPLVVLVEDARRAAAGWDRLVGFVWGLSDACFAQMPALQPGAFRPDGLAVLVGDGAPQPAAVDPVGQPAGEVADQPLVRRAD
jgi:hypothetical protein